MEDKKCLWSSSSHFYAWSKLEHLKHSHAVLNAWFPLFIESFLFLKKISHFSILTSITFVHWHHHLMVNELIIPCLPHQNCSTGFQRWKRPRPGSSSAPQTGEYWCWDVIFCKEIDGHKYLTQSIRASGTLFIIEATDFVKWLMTN